METIQQTWKNIKKETRKLQQLLDYEKKGLLTKDELERLVDEQQLENSEKLTNCCGVEKSLFGWCMDCGEQA